MKSLDTPVCYNANRFIKQRGKRFMKETNYQKFKNIKIREANEKIDSKEPKIKWTDANGMKLDDAYIAVQQVTHEIAKGMAKKKRN